MSDTSVSPLSGSGPGKVAVVVAHPGHELAIFHWMEQHRPLYCCLTDGSGRDAAPRLASTDRLLREVGASRGPFCGPFPDREVYRLLLAGRVDVFVALARELADALMGADVDVVAGDAAEGFNPVHDVCRFVLDGAVAEVRRRTGRVLRNYDFVLDARPDTCPETLRTGALWLRLDETALERKFEAALAYRELRDEVRAALLRFGKAAFAVECLRPAATSLMIVHFDHELPAYERYGEMRINAGHYREIIRYRQHVLPVRTAIEEADRV
jgi:hypothetical protein